MGSNQNFIELNGNRYDAVTGRLLTTENMTSAPAAVVARPQHITTSHQSLDGFTKRPAHKPAHTAIHKPAHPDAATAHAMHHKNERSKTLMRHAVKKPVPIQNVKAAPAPNHSTHHSSVPKKHESHHVDESRIMRASNVPKSALISRFGTAAQGHTKQVAPLAVQPAPEHAGIHHKPGSHHIHAAHEKPEDPLDSLNPFDMALQHANSHQEKRHKKPALRHRAAKKLRVTPRTFNIGTGLVVALLIGGFVAYRSMPQIALHLASVRAGIRANMPGYQPAGFSLSGPVQYSSGQITLNFQSNSDDRGFKVVQKSTEWNSQTLLENFVNDKEPYQTFQDKGRTVYIYDGSNATWVNGGVWYQIEGESALNSDQLLRIASSL